MPTPTTPSIATLKKQLLTLVGAVVVLDAVFIGAYYAFHVRDRAIKTQQVYIAVWVVCTLVIVTTLMRRIRKTRRGR